MKYDYMVKLSKMYVNMMVLILLQHCIGRINIKGLDEEMTKILF